MTDINTLKMYGVSILVLLAMIAALILLAYVMKKSGLIKKLSVNKKSPNVRLEIMDVLPLDSKNKLVLIRRDNVENLVFIGTNGTTVVERGIRHNDYENSFKETLSNSSETKDENDTRNKTSK